MCNANSIYVWHHRIWKPTLFEKMRLEYSKTPDSFVSFRVDENGGFGIQLRHPSYSARMHRLNLIRLDGKNRFEYATCGCVLILKRNKTSPLDKA